MRERAVRRPQGDDRRRHRRRRGGAATRARRRADRFARRVAAARRATRRADRAGAGGTGPDRRRGRPTGFDRRGAGRLAGPHRSRPRRGAAGAATRTPRRARPGTGRVSATGLRRRATCSPPIPTPPDSCSIGWPAELDARIEEVRTLARETGATGAVRGRPAGGARRVGASATGWQGSTSTSRSARSPTLEPATATALYGIVVEAVRNVMRHASAPPPAGSSSTRHADGTLMLTSPTTGSASPTMSRPGSGCSRCASGPRRSAPPCRSRPRHEGGTW